MMLSYIFLSLLVTVTFCHPSPHAPNGHIVGGNDVTAGQFPHMVSLYSDTNGNGKFHYCGGTIISPEWVLTAAHCIGGDEVKILMGAKDMSVEESSQVTRNATGGQIIIHELYKNVVTGNDIALLQLSPPVDFDNVFIGAINLPRPFNDPAAGTNVYPSGWGYTSDADKSERNTEDVLQYVDVQIISNEECAKSWSVIPSMICTTAGEQNICDGDSGGPINQHENMSDGGFSFGITSYGKPSCEADVPSVFTRVSSFIDWIEDKTGVKA